MYRNFFGSSGPEGFTGAAHTVGMTQQNMLADGGDATSFVNTAAQPTGLRTGQPASSIPEATTAPNLAGSRSNSPQQLQQLQQIQSNPSFGAATTQSTQLQNQMLAQQNMRRSLPIVVQPGTLQANPALPG